MSPDLANVDWSTATATVDRGERRAKVVHSARIPTDLSDPHESRSSERAAAEQRFHRAVVRSTLLG